jgi:hypothetical protein
MSAPDPVEVERRVVEARDQRTCSRSWRACLRVRAGHPAGVLVRASAVMPLTKSKTPGRFAFAQSTVSMIFVVSDFEKPRLRRKSVRSSLVRAMTRCAPTGCLDVNARGEASA